MTDLLKKNMQVSNFVKIRPMGVELFHVGIQTDMTKLIVAFHNFAYMPISECVNTSCAKSTCVYITDQILIFVFILLPCNVITILVGFNKYLIFVVCSDSTIICSCLPSLVDGHMKCSLMFVLVRNVVVCVRKVTEH